jgi:hypothetical protein
MHVDLAVGQAEAAERLLGRARAGGDPVEDADDRRALRAAVAGRGAVGAAQDVVGRDPPLSVRRSRQRHLHGAAGDGVADVEVLTVVDCDTVSVAESDGCDLA